MLYAHTHVPGSRSAEGAGHVDRGADGGQGLRRGRGQPKAPGTGLERIDYRFDVLADYGA